MKPRHLTEGRFLTALMLAAPARRGHARIMLVSGGMRRLILISTGYSVTWRRGMGITVVREC